MTEFFLMYFEGQDYYALRNETNCWCGWNNNPRKPRGKPTLCQSEKDLQVDAYCPHVSWRNRWEAKLWKYHIPPMTLPAGSFPWRYIGDEAKLSGGSFPAPDASYLTAEVLGSGPGRHELPPGVVKIHLGDSRAQKGTKRWDILESIRSVRKFC